MYTFFSKPDSVRHQHRSVGRREKFDTRYMSFEPLAVKYGETELIKGFERGINNASVQDSLMIFVPPNWHTATNWWVS